MDYESFDEIIGQPVSSLYMDPSQRAQYLRTLHAQGYVDDFGVRIKRKDGTPVDVSVSSSFSYDEHGNPVGMEGIIRDITERKKIEGENGKLADIFINTRTGMVTSGNNRLDIMNPAYAEMHGWTIEEHRPAGDGRDCRGLPESLRGEHPPGH